MKTPDGGTLLLAPEDAHLLNWHANAFSAFDPSVAMRDRQP